MATVKVIKRSIVIYWFIVSENDTNNTSIKHLAAQIKWTQTLSNPTTCEGTFSSKLMYVIGNRLQINAWKVFCRVTFNSRPNEQITIIHIQYQWMGFRYVFRFKYALILNHYVGWRIQYLEEQNHFASNHQF